MNQNETWNFWFWYISCMPCTCRLDHFHGLWKWRIQRPTKRRHVQGMLDETDPLDRNLWLSSPLCCKIQPARKLINWKSTSGNERLDSTFVSLQERSPSDKEAVGIATSLISHYGDSRWQIQLPQILNFVTSSFTWISTKLLDIHESCPFILFRTNYFVTASFFHRLNENFNHFLSA